MVLAYAVLFLKRQIATVERTLANSNLIIVHLINFATLACLIIVHAALYISIQSKGDTTAPGLYAAFDCNSIAIKCFETYLSSFLLYLIWKFAFFFENDGLRDQILRKLVPAPVFIQNRKLYDEFNDAILFDSV